MKKIGVIHTTVATVSTIQNLITEEIPGVQVINILDDSILDDMRTDTCFESVKKRWIQYAEILEEMDVDAILSACSTVGKIAEIADEVLSVPVYRIDRAMLEKAVTLGTKISVFATLSSTLEPTVELLKRLANDTCDVKAILVEGAYDCLMKNQKDEHDKLICDAVMRASETSDVIVLAQASMISALNEIAGLKIPVLTSPRLGIEKLKEELCKQ